MECQEIQSNEIEALRSIYVDEFELLESKKVWNKSEPARFNLHLHTPARKVQITLSVGFKITYPKSLPDLSLKNASGLLQSHAKELNTLVYKRATKLLGQEMIFELASIITDQLVEYESTYQNAAPSLAVARATKEATSQKAAKEAELEFLQEQQNLKDVEERVLDDMLHLEMSRRKGREREKDIMQQDLGEVYETKGLDPSMFFDYGRRVTISPAANVLLEFTHATRISDIVKTRQKRCYMVKPITRGGHFHDVILFHKIIDLKSKFWNSPFGKRRLNEMEADAEKVKQLRHTNINALYDFSVTRDETSGLHRVVVLQEFASKNSANDLLNTVGSVSLDVARIWAIQLLEGLDDLHKRGLSHKSIHLGNCVLTTSLHGNATTAKWTDVLVSHNIRSLIYEDTESTEFEPQHSLKWEAPELLNHSLDGYNWRVDIWHFGILLLQFIFGSRCVDKYDCPNALLTSNNSVISTPNFQDFFGKIFVQNPRKRPNAFDLLSMSFLRDPFSDSDARPTITHLASVTRDSQKSASNKEVQSSMVPREPAMSRYQLDFEELEVLGKGGYGQVAKVRNRLDGRLYAIKKIAHKVDKTLVNEVMLLSRLSHPNVVRYFTAFLEQRHDSVLTDETDEFGESQEKSVKHAKIESSHSQVVFDQPLDFISSRRSVRSYGNIQFGSGSESDGSDEETPSRESQLKSVFMENKTFSHSVIYIQMEYCERHTLRDLIRGDLHRYEDEQWRFLRQILEGLQHIHSQGIIHRDLKPENCFIDMSNNLKIGDFGLATSRHGYNDASSFNSTNVAFDDLTGGML